MQARKGGVKHCKTYLGEISYPNTSCLGSHVYVEYNEHCTSCSCGVEEHVEAHACSPESPLPFPAFPHSFSPQFLVLFILVGLLLLAYMAEMKQVATYEGVMLEVCGPVMKVFADISIIMYGFGANTAFLVVIGDQLEDSECGRFGDWVEGEGWM